MDEDLDLEELSPIKEKRKKIKKSYRKSEDSQQTIFINYLRKTYPHIVWRASPEGIRLSIGQATKMKRSGLIQRSLPDLEIFQPTTQFHGLFIEMKKEDFKLRKSDGVLYKNPHAFEQLETLNKLLSQGYFATFCCGADHAKNVLDAYLKEDIEKLKELQLI